MEPKTKCTLEEMERAVYRSLSFHHFPIPMENERFAPTDVVYVSKQSINRTELKYK